MMKRVIYSILTIVLSLSIIGLACSSDTRPNDVTVDSITTTTTTTTIPTYTITFDKNDSSASGIMSNQTIVSSSSTNLIPNGFAKSGWSFVGWAMTAGGSVAYADGAKYTMGVGNVTLYAKWLAYTDIVSISSGTYTQTDGSFSFSHTISSFSMGKYQVTYELWYTVRQWAITNGYTFANTGREGKNGTDGVGSYSR